MEWRRTIRRTMLFAATAFAVLIGVAYLVVHTKTFDRFLLAKLTEAVEARTEAPVEIKGIQIGWDYLGANLYGIKIYGEGGRLEPPLFQTDRLAIRLQWIPLFRGRVQLAELLLDRPVVHIRVNQQGQSNLPRPSSAGTSSPAVKTLFDLAVRRVAIRSGHIYYNDAEIPLSADLADVGMTVGFRVPSGRYQGELSYKNGRVTYDHFTPVRHSARLQFTAGRSGMLISPLTVSTAQSRITFHATLTNYADPDVSGTYDALVSLQELARIMKSSRLPAGEVASAGTIGYRRVRGQSLLQSLRMAGRVSSPHLGFHLRQVTAALESLRGTYSLERGDLRIANLQTRLLGGQLLVSAGAIDLTGRSHSQLSATLRNVSLPDVSNALPAGFHSRLSFAGRADVSTQVSWSGGFRDLIVKALASISAQRPARLQSAQIPIRGTVQVTYREAQDEASFAHSRLHIGSTTISLDGVLSEHSNLDLMLNTSNLHELAGLGEQFAEATRSPGAPPVRFPNLNGSAQFDGRLFGSPRRPELQGHLSAARVGIGSTNWRAIRTDILASPSTVALNHAVLVSMQGARIQLRAGTALQHWSFAPSSSLSIQATVANLRASELEKMANVNYPVSGILSANISVEGTKQNPTGRGTIRIANASAWSQPVGLATVNLQGGRSSLQAQTTLHFASGVASGSGEYAPHTRQYQFEVSVSGVKIGDIRFLQARHLGISGTLAASANGRGSIDRPELAATLAVPQLMVRGQLISNAQAQLGVSDRTLHFTAEGTADEGTAQANGDVALTGGFDATAALDIHGLSLGTLIARYLPKIRPGVQAALDAHAELRGPLKDPSRLALQAAIPAMSIRYEAAHVALVRPLRLDYHDGIATIEKTEIKGTGIDLALQGAIPVKHQAPLSIAAKGTVNLSLLQAMTNGIRSSGQLTMDIEAVGKPTQPTVQGSIRVENVSLSTVSMPLILSGLNGQLRVSGNRIEITGLRGNIGGGSMSAQGSMIYGANPNFNLAVQAQSVNLNYPAGLLTRLDWNLQLNGTKAQSALTGRVIIDYLGFAQNYDVATLASQFASSPAPTMPSAFEKGMKLDVAVQSANTLNAATSQLSVQGAVNLILTGTLANPVVLGRTTLTGGEVFFFGKRYAIQSGNVQFSNPAHTSPSVNLYATTTVSQYTISLHFLGPVDQMKTSFTSSPPLPPADIINLLAFGKTSEQAASSPATPGVLGAESLLAQGVTSQISGKIQRLAGISQLSITPIIGGANQVPGAQVAIQQRVTGRLLVTFTTNTAATQNTAVQVQYQLGHGLSISTLRDHNGGYGIDVHLHKSF
jgi:translocation and assembly module TamB